MAMLEVNSGPNEAPITELYVFLSIDENGNEGICGEMINGRWMSMTTSKPRIVEIMMPRAEIMARATGKTIRLVRFTNREVIKTIGG